MKIVLPARRRKSLATFGTFAVILLFASGCHSSDSLSASDAAKLKENFSKTGFNINDVPPAQRERVKALMQQNGATNPNPTK